MRSLLQVVSTIGKGEGRKCEGFGVFGEINCEIFGRFNKINFEDFGKSCDAGVDFVFLRRDSTKLEQVDFVFLLLAQQSSCEHGSALA